MTDYKKLRNEIKHVQRPIVLINVCTHGDEPVGLSVIQELKKLNIKKGTLLFNVANERAVKQKKRFIDKDLNRVFPGKKNGVYEERIAHELTPIIKEADIFLDIHSTRTGSPKSLIVEKLDKGTLSAIRAIHPKRVVCIGNEKGNSSVSQAKVGIGFEYGSDAKNVAEGVAKDIKRLLKSKEMISGTIVPRKNKIEIYKQTHPVPKLEGYEICSGIKNFIAIPKGAVFAKKKDATLKAAHKMYPILFGRNNEYKDIFGFAARKLEKI